MKLLVFDMGHVLIDFNWDAVCHGFCERAGIERDALRPHFNELSKLGYESGAVDTDRFLSELNTRLGTAITRQEFTQLWTRTFSENVEMAELLTTLKQQVPLYLLSNTNEVHYDWIEEQFKVSRHFEHMLLSYVERCAKPDEAIYKKVLDRSGFAAGECLFVDDLQVNCDAAMAVGMQAHVFAGAAGLKTQLRGFGLSV